MISNEVHELPLDPSTLKSISPLASIAKKISPSVAEAVAAGRRADVDRTMEAALEQGRLSKNDLRTLRKQC